MTPGTMTRGEPSPQTSGTRGGLLDGAGGHSTLPDACGKSSSPAGVHTLLCLHLLSLCFRKFICVQRLLFLLYCSYPFPSRIAHHDIPRGLRKRGWRESIDITPRLVEVAGLSSVLHGHGKHWGGRDRTHTEVLALSYTCWVP